MKISNYCSLEISKKLVDTEIVLETDCCYDLALQRLGVHKWTAGFKAGEHHEIIPAPTFVEIWTELPREYNECVLCLMAREVGVEIGYYSYNNECMLYTFDSSNPANAAAELLIWVKEQNYNKIKNTLIDRASKLKW